MSDDSEEALRKYTRDYMRERRKKERGLRQIFSTSTSLAEVIHNAQAATNEELESMTDMFDNPKYKDAVSREIRIRNFLKRDRPYYCIPISGG